MAALWLLFVSGVGIFVFIEVTKYNCTSINNFQIIVED